VWWYIFGGLGLVLFEGDRMRKREGRIWEEDRGEGKGRERGVNVGRW
jgi:hypothetical protein